jgi:hypothetical protein
MSTTATATAAPQPGQFFEVPGVAGGGTQFYEQYEPTEDLAFAVSATNQVTLNGIQAFGQTDVVLDWMIEVNLELDWTAGPDKTLYVSPYAPHNILGPFELPVQNQYSPVDVENGIDLYLFNIIRPRYKQARRTNLGYNFAGDPSGGSVTGYPAAGNAQDNVLAPAQFTDATTSLTLFYHIPGATQFDVYSDLAGVSSANVSGNQGAFYHHCYVSPQYMGGTVRNVLPKVKVNPMLGTSADETPVWKGNADIVSTFSSSAASITFKRFAVYNNNDPAVLPPQFPWQTSWVTDRQPANGSQKLKFMPPNDTGQILSMYLRLWDPTLNDGAGGPIDLAGNIDLITVSYATGVINWQGTVLEWQEYWARVNGVLLPPGVIAFDWAKGDNDQVTNLNVLNTLTTSTIQLALQMSSPTSASAYGVLGMESLSLVSIQ